MMPVQVTIRDNSLSSSALESTIRKRANKLSHYNCKISSCRVVAELSQKHKHQGKIYNVRIDVTVPGKEFATTHKCDQDIYIAVREAFDAIIRQLEEHAQKRHGRVKTQHEDIMHGHVTRIMPKQGYGFIEGLDGNEYYFNDTSVTYPKFDQLCVGDAVLYQPNAITDGLQAHKVIKERHHTPL